MKKRYVVTTPWIALISCDANSTRASQSSDVFTLAYQRGALSAVITVPISTCSHVLTRGSLQLLYSEWSQWCIINSDNRIMDVFTTPLSESQDILSHFVNFGNSTDGEYNASALNASQAIINQSLDGIPAASEPGYLFSRLSGVTASSDSSRGASISKTTLVT